MNLISLPKTDSEFKRAATVASVVLIIAVTPTAFDAVDAWEKHPHVRPLLFGWYVFAVLVAFSAWRYL